MGEELELENWTNCHMVVDGISFKMVGRVHGDSRDEEYTC